MEDEYIMPSDYDLDYRYDPLTTMDDIKNELEQIKAKIAGRQKEGEAKEEKEENDGVNEEASKPAKKADE